MPPHILCILALALALPAWSAVEEAPGAGILALPEVLTPSRLAQPRSDVPGSVTIIDQQLITASGARSLVEVLRLVPGMSVTHRDGWNPVVSYHGTTYRDNRRMQVLVDGRSIYQAGLATIDWNDIPLDIRDIERIEVHRGPNSASYGANAFLGVIQIITRRAGDEPGLSMSVRRGSLHTEDYHLAHSGHWQSGAWRISAGSLRDTGFDERRDGTERRDSQHRKFVQGTVSLELSPVLHWDVWGGYSDARYDEELSDATMRTTPDPEVRDSFFSSRWRWEPAPNRNIQAQLSYSEQRESIDWLACAPPGLLSVTSAASEVCGQVNEDGDNSRTDFDLQDTWTGNDWKLMYGTHFQHKRVESETFYNGVRKRDSIQFFLQGEWRFHPQWRINLGGLYENEERLDDYFMPRGALIWQPHPEHSFRAVYSEAVRAPDLFETEADWSYLVRGISPSVNGPVDSYYPYTAQGNPNLEEERIQSREYGYYGRVSDWGLELDIKFFTDRFSNLITRSLTLENQQPRNTTSLQQRGYEVELDWQPTPILRTRLSYARIRSSTIDFREQDFTPDHSGSALVSWQFAQGWQVSAAYYYARPINSRKFSRADFRLAKRLQLGGTELELAATLRQRLDRDGELFSDNSYHRRNHFLITADFYLP